MYIISRSPVMRVLVPYALSAVAGMQLKLDPCRTGLLITCVLLLGLQCFLYQRRRSGHLSGCTGSVLTFMVAAMCGLSSGISARPEDPDLPCSAEVILCGNITSNPELRNEKLCFDLEVRMLAKGDSVLIVRTGVKAYVPWAGGDHDQQTAFPEQASCILMCGTLVPIVNAGNPGEVDYEAIFRRKGIWYHFYGEGMPRQMKVRNGSGACAARIRQKMSAAWSGKERSIQLLQAICLGDKSDLASWVREDYARAGAMHILAVSGLHVGLIWWVLNRMLFFLTVFRKSAVPKTLIIVLLLWAYAWLTGFSSSVCRSVCMFSLFSLASITGRKATSVNTVMLSMMLVLLVQPGRILEAGFQLSYCAVLSIVGFMPLFRRLVKTRSRVLQWVWEGSVLSFTAQLGTLPLAIYYFHRIPIYGMVSNLITLPMLTLIVSLFVISVPMTFFPSLAVLFGKALVGLTTMMDLALSRVAALPAACLEGQHMEGFTVFQYFLLLISIGFLFGRSRKVLPLLATSLSISVLVLYTGWKTHQLRGLSYVQVSHFRGASMVSLVEGIRADHYIWCKDLRYLSSLDAYLEQAWSPTRYEHSVMLMVPDDNLSSKGGISMCRPLGKDCWLLGNNNYSMAVLRGRVYGANLACLQRSSVDDILFSDLNGFSGTLPQSTGPGAPQFLADGSNPHFAIEKIRQIRKGVFNTREQGAYVFPL